MTFEQTIENVLAFGLGGTMKTAEKEDKFIIDNGVIIAALFYPGLPITLDN